MVYENIESGFSWIRGEYKYHKNIFLLTLPNLGGVINSKVINIQPISTHADL